MSRTFAPQQTAKFDLGIRSQSESRCHRFGTKRHVTYSDLCAMGAIDEDITRSLQRKTETAKVILDNRGSRDSSGIADNLDP